MKMIVENHVRITGYPRSLLSAVHSRFVLTNPQHESAEKYGRSTRGVEPYLQFPQVDHDGSLVLPRGAARDILTMAQQHGQVDIDDRRLKLPELNLTFHGKLRAYQEQAVKGVLVKDFGTLEAGTGSGKTVMALAIIAARRQPTLILVHTKELLFQWKDRIKQFLGIEAGLIGGGKFDIQPVTVGIVNSVRASLDGLTDRFGHIVIDECHRVPASMFTETLKAFPAFYSLGLSATPFRRDGLGDLIAWFVGLHKVPVSLATLHEVGAVLRPKIVSRSTEFRWSYEDDYQDMISALVNDQARNYMITRDIREQAGKGGLSLVVSDRTAHLQDLAMMADVGGEVLTGKTPAKKRREIVERLAGGDVPVLFSTLSLIGEGFDCPSMDSVFLTTPIKFAGRLKQVVGRVLRPAEGKQPLVYDYHDLNIGILSHQWKCRQRVYAAIS